MTTKGGLWNDDLRVWWFKEIVSCLLGHHGDSPFVTLLGSDENIPTSLVRYLDNRDGILEDMPAIVFYEANSLKRNGIQDTPANQGNGDSAVLAEGRSSPVGTLLGSIV